MPPRMQLGAQFSLGLGLALLAITSGVFVGAFGRYGPNTASPLRMGLGPCGHATEADGTCQWLLALDIGSFHALSSHEWLAPQ